ncbi:hypothetical protein ACJDT4_10125 [Clostridium neuense]|uniref:Uncharacterized protein n=1 Tax=Clostridium neuense TaxID=1728934 RepID=A0ABW8TG93_9CLOT
MGYFYGTLIFELIFYIFCIYKIIIGLKVVIKDKKKGYLILIIILIPLATCFFYDVTIPKIKDIKYALNEDLLVHKGTVEKTYLTGKVNIFVLDGKEYQYNPWKFKPIQKNKYELHYLPNSRFVVKYEEEQHKNSDK